QGSLTTVEAGALLGYSQAGNLPGGTINTVAGNGTGGFIGDGGPALAAMINPSYGVGVDGGGNIYFVDGASRIRKVDTSGNINTVAGTGLGGFSGDGGLATAAKINPSNDVTADESGNLYFVDGASRIRKVDLGGSIYTVAGN